MQKKKNISKKLIVLNIMLLLLALAVVVAIKMSPDSEVENSNKEQEKQEEVKGENTQTTINENTEEIITSTSNDANNSREEENSANEIQTGVEVNGQYYTFDNIPVISLGTRFRIFGTAEALAEVEIVVKPEQIKYTTKVKDDKKWFVEVDTNLLGEGDHSFQSKVILPGEINGNLSASVAFKVKDQDQTTSKADTTGISKETNTTLSKDKIYDTLTTLPVLLSAIALGIIVCLVTAFLLIKKKNPMEISVDTRISNSDPGSTLNPEVDLKIRSNLDKPNKEEAGIIDEPTSGESLKPLLEQSLESSLPTSGKTPDKPSESPHNPSQKPFPTKTDIKQSPEDQVSTASAKSHTKQQSHTGKTTAEEKKDDQSAQK
ncbi:hypothetical protein JW796_00460 [Candidatus Dojkabacteria bacterium]|nr:hypothetical protein [Candidatus Dojkabacteria bacterium]